ncbi:MAG: CRISPR-associated endonuclease Cas2 [Candidatus Omnitrophica bacterium]|nr:CRISPR-associated endonuclease Cas2 [Candidatus Omnitrophota bacterium]
MFVVVSYDIIDDKRRQKISQKLEDYGKRVQYSVFECILDEVKFKEMIKELVSFIEEEDSLRFYNLCEGCLKRIKVFGMAEVTKDEDVYIV